MGEQIFRGDRLKEHRVKQGLSQEELAARILSTQSQVAKYETGKVDPSPELIVKFSRELNVTSDYLLGLVNLPNERLQEENLTPAERKLLNAYRSGDMRTALKALLQEG